MHGAKIVDDVQKFVLTDNICEGDDCGLGSCQTRSGGFVYISILSDCNVTVLVVSRYMSNFLYSFSLLYNLS